MLEVFGISGKLGVGKDYTARVLQQLLPPLPTLIIAFVDTLKIRAIVLDHLDPARVFGHKDQKTRHTLQQRGTEEGRNVYGNDVWIRYLQQTIEMYAQRGIQRFIVTDVRFPNEAEFLRKTYYAFLIRIVAPQRHIQQIIDENIETSEIHTSETAMDIIQDPYFDAVLNNEVDDPLLIQLRDMVLTWEKTRKKNKIKWAQTSGAWVFFCDLDDTICQCSIYYYQKVFQVRDIICANLSSTNENIQREVEQSFHNLDPHQDMPFLRDQFPHTLVKYWRLWQPKMKPLDQDKIDAIENNIRAIALSVYDSPFDAVSTATVSALRTLQQWGTVVIFTIGHRVDQFLKLVRLGIDDIILEVADYKDKTLFRQLQNKYPAQQYVMIGDSWKRDILPAMDCKNINHLFHVDKNVARQHYIHKDTHIVVGSLEACLQPLRYAFTRRF